MSLSATFVADTALPCRLWPSPNHGDRKSRAIDSVILHYTGTPDTEDALTRLSDPKYEVSSHYLVDEHGDIFQLVPESRRAWHAGRSFWQGETDMNSASIGIEISNPGHDGGLPPFGEKQIATVIALCREIAARRKIAPERFLAHSDIAPSRKQDPGELFPWAAFAAAGIGLWPNQTLQESDIPVNSITLAMGACGYRIAAMQASLGRWGLDLPQTGVFDRATFIGIMAFQRHFRPTNVDGVADGATLELLRRVTRDIV